MRGRVAKRAVFGGLAAGLALATLAPARPTRAADDGGAPASASGDAGSTADAGLGSAVVSASRRGLVVPPDLDDVEHMCALLTGCASLPITSAFAAQGFVACVRRVWDELASPGAVQFSLTLRECGLRASSCGDLRACALRGARPDACAGRGKQGAASHCDADGRAITCLAEQVTSVRDCPRGGEQCAIREGGAACVLGACEADTPRACSASGTKILQCDRGKLLSMDCAALGLRCASGPSGPACATTSAACSGGGKRCEGATAVTCLNGHEVKIDCAAAGLECGGSADALAVGACATSSVPSCDASAPPRCDGAILKYCAAGRPRGYFCKSLGLSRCVTDARGARCAP